MKSKHPLNIPCQTIQKELSLSKYFSKGSHDCLQLLGLYNKILTSKDPFFAGIHTILSTPFQLILVEHNE